MLKQWCAALRADDSIFKGTLVKQNENGTCMILIWYRNAVEEYNKKTTKGDDVCDVKSKCRKVRSGREF